MPLSIIEQHYLKHKEELRLQRRHGQVEFSVTMHHLHTLLAALTADGRKPQDIRILDIGAGTGHYTHALRSEGYQVKAVELVQHNIDVMRKQDAEVDVVKGDARHLDMIADSWADITLLLGPLYHLIGDTDKVRALSEARRVTRQEGCILAAYLMNEYSILSYCFDEDRMPQLHSNGFVDDDYHVRTPEGELYDYVRIEDIDRLNNAAGLQRRFIFSPDGAADYMRTRLNRMSETSFQMFINYQTRISTRPDLIGAGSHVVDVLKK